MIPKLHCNRKNGTFELQLKLSAPSGFSFVLRYQCVTVTSYFRHCNMLKQESVPLWKLYNVNSANIINKHECTCLNELLNRSYFSFQHLPPDANFITSPTLKVYHKKLWTLGSK